MVSLAEKRPTEMEEDMDVAAEGLSQEQAEEQSEALAQGQSEDQPEEQSEAQSEEQLESQSEEQSQERSEESPEEQSAEQAQEQSEEQPEEQSEAQAQEQVQVQEQSEDQAVEQSDEKPEERLGGELEEDRDGQSEERAYARPEELRLLEAILFAAAGPVDEAALAQRMPEGVAVRAMLDLLEAEYAMRGVNLVRVGGAWTFRTAADLSWLLTRETVVSRKLSRAAIETLAIIAYHQPVTRAEIEDVRGVTTSKGTLDVLLETGWIKPRGRRKVVGRPLTYGTTSDFLGHFGLEAVGDLPGLEELKGSGLLDGRMPAGFSIPTPSDSDTLRDDEDPLDPGDLDLGLAPPPERIEE